MQRINLLSIWIILGFSAYSQPKITLEKIMSGQDFVGYSPENVRWKQNESGFLFDHKTWKDSVQRTYFYDIKTNKKRLATQADFTDVTGNLNWNINHTQALYEKNGDIYIWDQASKKSTLQVNFHDDVQSPQWVQNGFVFQWNQSIMLIQKEQISEFAQFQDNKSTNLSTDNSKDVWLKKQQLELFQVLNERNQQLKRNRQARISEKAQTPIMLHLDGASLSQWNVSFDLQTVVYTTQTSNKNTTETKVPHWITQSGYVEIQSSRPKVGEILGNSTIHYATKCQQNWTQKVIKIAHLSGQTDHPSELTNIDRTKAKEVVLFGLMRNPTGNLFLLEAQSTDNKDRWILIFQNDSIIELNHQHDDAWIGGPGISSWRSGDSDFGWYDSDEVYYQSERTGYSHVYLQSIHNKSIKSITQGPFEVMNLVFHVPSKTFYCNANPEHPGKFGAYRIDPVHQKLLAITPTEKQIEHEDIGFYEFFLSPSATQFVYRISSISHPWELAISANKNRTIQLITQSVNPEYVDYNFHRGSVINFPGKDTQNVYARIYRPEKAMKNGAAVIFVHGAGYLQNAHYWWSNYYREFMFHHLLSEKGYTVLDIDYRASSGYGRNWRTGIYRHMGGWDLNDQMSGREFLINKENIDPKRIGIYGGSYGGFMTLMALFTQPDSFACGAALRSVTDWAHYNHGYTSNILNTPETDSLSFARSSPINFAQNLKQPLIMLHGMVDDNVQFQDVVRLSQKLIELEKNNWELAVYPVENHGFKERSSWLDEYKRIYKLFDSNLILNKDR